METINEGSFCRITVNFLDDAEEAVEPDSCSYRIDDHDSQAEILPLTILFPAEGSSGGESCEIEIPGELNRILNPCREIEIRVVTVKFNYNENKTGTNEYRYWVKRMDNINLLEEESP